MQQLPEEAQWDGAENRKKGEGREYQVIKAGGRVTWVIYLEYLAEEARKRPRSFPGDLGPLPHLKPVETLSQNG